MKRFFSFFKDSYKLGLSKNIILISILFYLGSVFFEAVGLSLILPIFSIIFEGQGSEIILGNSQFVDKMFYYIDYMGIPSDKYSIIILLIIVILLRQFMVFTRTCWSAAMIAKIVYGLRIKTFSDFLVVKEDFFKKPYNVPKHYKSPRWRKYLTRIWLKKYKKYRLYFGQYICRNYNRKHRGQRRLKNFSIHFMREKTNLIRKNIAKKRTIWNHNCFKNRRQNNGKVYKGRNRFK